MKQTLSLRPEDKDGIVIPTVSGLITIKRAGKDLRKLKIELPHGLKAYIGRDRALQDSRFLELKDDKLLPKFSLLAPIYGHEGELLGVDMPGTLRLEGKV